MGTAGGLGGCLIKKDHYVETARIVRAKGDYSVSTQILKCHVCAQNAMPPPETSVLFRQGAGWGVLRT